MRRTYLSSGGARVEYLHVRTVLVLVPTMQTVHTLELCGESPVVTIHSKKDTNAPTGIHL